MLERVVMLVSVALVGAVSLGTLGVAMDDSIVGNARGETAAVKAAPAMALSAEAGLVSATGGLEQLIAAAKPIRSGGELVARDGAALAAELKTAVASRDWGAFERITADPPAVPTNSLHELHDVLERAEALYESGLRESPNTHWTTPTAELRQLADKDLSAMEAVLAWRQDRLAALMAHWRLSQNQIKGAHLRGIQFGEGLAKLRARSEMSWWDLNAISSEYASYLDQSYGQKVSASPYVPIAPGSRTWPRVTSSSEPWGWQDVWHTWRNRWFWPAELTAVPGIDGAVMRSAKNMFIHDTHHIGWFLPMADGTEPMDLARRSLRTYMAERTNALEAAGTPASQGAYRTLGIIDWEGRFLHMIGDSDGFVRDWADRAGNVSDEAVQTVQAWAKDWAAENPTHAAQRGWGSHGN